MTAALRQPTFKTARAFHLARWEEVCKDPVLQLVPGRVETNRFGHLVMMPPPGLDHSFDQFSIGRLIHSLLSGGRVMTECAVLTADGIKGADTAWISHARLARSRDGQVLTIAPEICVEVISPSNTRAEFDNKRQLYFAAGADEVWLCDLEGRLHFYLAAKPTRAAKRSALCPDMPLQVRE